MYNEMEPNNADPAYLAQCNAAIYTAMTSANPKALYLMQAWLFHSDFWTYDRVKAFLSGVPIGKMILLDLNSEAGPVWNQYDSFFGHTCVSIAPFAQPILHTPSLTPLPRVLTDGSGTALSLTAAVAASTATLTPYQRARTATALSRQVCTGSVLRQKPRK